MTSLREELIGDPEGIGYAGMTGEQIITSIHALVRPRNRTSMTHTEVLNTIVLSEFNGLAADKQENVWNVLKMGGEGLNPFGVEATIFIDAFGDSDTITALKAARVELISRVQEIGVGAVSLKTLKLESIR